MDQFDGENRNTLQDLTEEEKNKILSRPVKLQGRGFTSLGNLIDDSMFSCIKFTDFSNILGNDFSIGNEIKSPPDYNIERSVSRIFLDPHVLQEVDDDFFLIDNSSERCIYKLPIRHPNVCELEDLDFDHLNRCRIILIDKTNNLDKVEKLKDTGKSVHFLSVYDLQHLEWKWSCGSAKRLKPFHIHLDIFENNSIYTFSNTIRILSAPPGMGKTLFMDHVAHRTDANVWVLKVNLSECYKIVKDTSSTSSALEYLTYFNEMVTDKCDNPVLSRLVFYKMAKSKRVLVILDGFDEVPLCYIYAVMDIAKSFHSAKLAVWLTTSPVLAPKLEEEFGTISFNLKPFNLSDQKSFAVKYCSYLNLVYQPIDEYVKNLKFVQTPLQIKLLLDVLQKKICFKNELHNENYNLLGLYTNFIETRCPFNDTDDGMVQNYLTLLALKLLFPLNNYIISDITKELQDYDKNYPNNIQFLQNNDIVASNLTFTHHTFAEYLIAAWLAKNLNRESAQDLLRERCNQSYNLLFRFFDETITEKCTLHKAILNREIEEAKGILSSRPECANEVDYGRRSFLHLAALCCVQFPQPLFNQKKFTSEEELFLKLKTFDKDPMLEMIHHSSEGASDDILGYSPLDYALLNRSLTFANKLCTELKNSAINAKIDLNFKNKYLSYCIILGYESLFRVLLRYFSSRDVLLRLVKANMKLGAYFDDTLSRNFLESYREMTIQEFLQNGCFNLNLEICFGSDEIFRQDAEIAKQDIDKNTALHYAASHGKLETAYKLIASGVNVNKQNFDGNTPLHLAAKLGYANIVQLLVSNHSNANIENIEGFIPLHYSAQGGYSSVSEFLCKISDINKQTVEGETALHLALENGHLDIAKILISNGASFDMVNKKGETPLHTAAYYDRGVMVAELMTHGADVNKQTNSGNTPIHLATSQDYTETPTLLLLNGADVNIENGEGLIPLHYIARGGCIEIMDEILSKTTNLNKLFNDGGTILHWFSIFGELDIVKLLLSNGADINIKNNLGFIPLHSAAIGGYLDIVYEILLKDLTHLNDQDNDGDTALHMSSIKGHKNITKLLINTGADINLQNKKGRTPLHCAAEGGYSDIVAQLTPKIANINKQDNKGETALYLAVKFRCKHTAKFLLSNGAAVNAENEEGQTVLHRAALVGQNEIISELLHKGVLVNKQDKNGETPLHLASREGYETRRIKLLIDNGADVNIENKKGRTAIYNACIGGYIDKVKALLPKISNVNKMDNNGETLLHWVSILGHNELAKVLISKGADVNIENKEGCSSLHYAAKRGYNIIVEEILAKDAMVNKQDNDGNTPIHLASMEGHVVVAKLLLLCGADVNIVNRTGWTAIRYATENGYDEVAELLRGTDLSKL